MNHSFKKILVLLLAVLLLCTLLPAAALAEDEEGEPSAEPAGEVTSEPAGEVSSENEEGSSTTPGNSVTEAAPTRETGGASGEPLPGGPGEPLPGGEAEDILANGFEGDGLIWALSTGGHLTIGKSGAMSDYTEDTVPWSSNRASVRSITFSAGVTGIGACAFSGCTNLASVTIPANISAIGASAFSGCTGLTRIIFIGNLPFIADNAFAGVNADAFFPAGNTDYLQAGNYGGSLFWNYGTCADGLDWHLSHSGTLTISGSGTAFITDVFQNRTDIVNVIFNTPDLKSIGRNAFSGCSGLQSITMPSGLTSIGDNAFSGCSNLQSISVPGSAQIGFNAFHGCIHLSLQEDQNGLAIINNALVGYYGDGGDVIIPDGVTVIDDGVFTGCTTLTGITIPSGVTGIPDNAFKKCTSLTTVNLPDTLTRIGRSAFSECKALTTIKLPRNLESIGDHAFSYCKSLAEISIPSCVTSIGDRAFMSCTALKEITIPSGVKTLNDWTFAYCSSLNSVTLSEGLISMIGAFCSCNSLTEITFPSSLTEIKGSAFGNDSSLTMIRFTGNMPLIHSDTAFQYVTATAYYPAGNATYTEEKMQNYSGNLTWVPSGAGFTGTNYLNISSDLKLGFYVNKAAEVEDLKVVFTMGSYTKEVTDDTVDASDSSKVCFVFDGISPQFIGTPVLAEVYADGKKVDAFSRSILDYLGAIYESNPEYQAVIADLVDYGIAANAYCAAKGYVTGDAFTRPGWLTAGPSTAVPTEADKFTKTAAAEGYDGNVYNFLSANVIFDVTNTLTISFTMPEGASFCVNGNPVSVGANLVKNGDTYTYYCRGLTAKQYLSSFTFAIRDGGNTVRTLTYGIGSYAYSKYIGADGAMKDLALATYRLGASAAAA